MPAYWTYETSTFPKSNVSVHGNTYAEVESMRNEIILLNGMYTLEQVTPISQLTNAQYCCVMFFKTDVPIELWKSGALHLPIQKSQLL